MTPIPLAAFAVVVLTAGLLAAFVYLSLTPAWDRAVDSEPRHPKE